MIEDTNRLNAFAFFVMALCFVSLNLPGYVHAEESSCISCHTSLRNIVTELRETGRLIPEEGESESTGEG